MAFPTVKNDPFSPARWPGVTFTARPVDLLDPPPITQAAIAPRQTTITGGCTTCGTAVLPAPLPPYRLFSNTLTPPGNVEVWTLRYGNAWYLSEMGKTVDDWASRMGYRLRIHTGTGFDPAQFAKLDMIRQFLDGSAEWFVFIDADCILHPDAPSIMEAVTAPGLWALRDLESTAAKWSAWLAQHGHQTPPGYTYRNTGVMVMDRDTASALLEVAAQPFLRGYLEQHQFNLWFSQAGIVMRDLPDRWNSFRSRLDPAWNFHFAGHRKDRRLQDLRQHGRLPDPVKSHPNPPAVPDFGKGAVVWPWLSTAAEWDELWFSHRSVLRHWSERDWPLVLLGDRRPDWWPGEFLHAPRYEDALWIGVQCAERVLWLNDDIFMLADQSPETLAFARETGDMTARLGQTMVAQNSWRRGLGQVLMRCHHHGRTCRNFSTHTPYLYERTKAREILDRFGVFHKIPFETAYHNWHRTPCAPCTEKALGPHDLTGKLWINPAARQVTPQFRSLLEERFSQCSPSPARFAQASA